MTSMQVFHSPDWAGWVYRHRVQILAGSDAALAVLLGVLGAVGAGRLGPSWLGPSVATLILTVILAVLYTFAVYCWQGWDGPGPPGQPRDTIQVILAAAAGIILAYTVLYWTMLKRAGWPAFYAAAGTFTAVHPADVNAHVGQVLLVSQGLVDLLFLGMVVPIVLARAADRQRPS